MDVILKHHFSFLVTFKVIPQTNISSVLYIETCVYDEDEGNGLETLKKSLEICHKKRT